MKMAIFSDFEIIVPTLNSSCILQSEYYAPKRSGNCLYMTTSLIKVPSQKIPVPKITMQTKSHNLNFNVLSSVVDSSGDEV